MVFLSIWVIQLLSIFHDSITNMVKPRRELFPKEEKNLAQWWNLMNTSRRRVPPNYLWATRTRTLTLSLKFALAILNHTKKNTLDNYRLFWFLSESVSSQAAPTQSRRLVKCDMLRVYDWMVWKDEGSCTGVCQRIVLGKQWKGMFGSTRQVPPQTVLPGASGGSNFSINYAPLPYYCSPLKMPLPHRPLSATDHPSHSNSNGAEYSGRIPNLRPEESIKGGLSFDLTTPNKKHVGGGWVKAPSCVSHISKEQQDKLRV